MKKICLVLSALALCCTMLIGAGTVGTSSQMSLTQQAITHLQWYFQSHIVVSILPRKAFAPGHDTF